METTAIVARHGAGNTAKSAKSKIWLGDLDSNHDYRLLQVLTRRYSELLDARREPGQVARRTADQQHGCNLGFARRANAALIDQAMPRLANIAFSWLC